MSDERKKPTWPKGDLDALTVVASFLAWAEKDQPNMMYGSWKVTEALEGLAHLTHTTARQLRRLAE